LDGPISDANDAFLGMLGYSRQDLLAGSVSWAQMTPPEYRAADQQAAAELAATGSCQPYEKQFFHKDGSRIPVLVGGALFEESKEYGVAFVLDLTERKQAESDRQARLAAEEASRAKSEFLANMSHELRTPLNAVLGYAQILLQEKGLNERQATGLKTIQQSGEHLLTLITDLLDLAKIEAGKLELFPTHFNLPAFLRTIANIIRIRAEEKDLLFILDLAADLPQAVDADEKRLRQVLLNLLGNAVKFTERGHVRLRVRRLPSEGRSARLVFEVDDTGVGMRGDQLEAIFQPFEQVGDVQSRAGGTGLGLAISRQLVHLMESDIQVKSQEGEGSLFSFELVLPMVAGAGAAALTARRPSSYLGARRRVLVVDDVATNRVLMVHLLQRFGFAVSEASNGQEGLERAHAERPDLILMDLMMPVMDGLEATRRMRQTPDLAQIPIIILSASAAQEDLAAGEAAGASGFVSKPIDPYGLVQELGRHLGLSWVYPPSPATAEPAAAALVVPPPEEMATLYEMVMASSMHGIRQEATRLAELDRRYRPFADKLLQLAQGCQSQALLSLVEKFMERQENP
ncbi:MAG: response regulator, partial [Pseudomonas sp.]